MPFGLLQKHLHFCESLLARGARALPPLVLPKMRMLPKHLAGFWFCIDIVRHGQER